MTSVVPREQPFMLSGANTPSMPWQLYFEQLSLTSNNNTAGLSSSQDVQTDSSSNLVSIANTGTIFNVMSESPDLTGTATLVNGTVSGTFNIGSTIDITGFIDDDTFATASNTTGATSESIKAYVDSSVTSQDLDFGGDSGTGSVDLDSQVFTISGTSGEIETSASGQTLTIGLPTNVDVDGTLDVGGDVTINGIVEIDNGSSGATPAGSPLLVLEDNTSVELNILTPDASYAQFAMSSPSSSDAAGFWWNYDLLKMRFFVTDDADMEFQQSGGLTGVINFQTNSQDILTLTNSAVKNHKGVINEPTRVTTTYTILVSDYEVFGNTDSAGFTATLPAGVEGQTFRIVNTGTSGNTLTIAPNGSEHLIGVNSNFNLADGEGLIITYNATDGWY